MGPQWWWQYDRERQNRRHPDKQSFGSVQLHVEWRNNPDNKATNQNRSNSGVFLQNRYEATGIGQQRQSHLRHRDGNPIYKQSIPLVMAAKPLGIGTATTSFSTRARVMRKANKTKSGTLAVLLNGVLVQDHLNCLALPNAIGWPKNDAHGPAPIGLQDHGDQSGVKYRNIWVRNL